MGIISLSSDYNVNLLDNKSLLLVDTSAGNVSIQLPYAVDIDQIAIRKIDSSSNIITITVKGNNTINGTTDPASEALREIQKDDILFWDVTAVQTGSPAGLSMEFLFT